MEEEWRPILGAETYEVSNLGRVRSWRGPGGPKNLRNEPYLMRAGCVKPKGKPTVIRYASVGIRFADGIRRVAVHRLVLEAFVTPRPEGMECRHLDCDPSNNKLSNLAWGTHQENIADSVRKGRTARGSRLPQARLTESDIPVIRSRIAAGDSLTLLAALYDVSISTILRVKQNNCWQCVPGDR